MDDETAWSQQQQAIELGNKDLYDRARKQYQQAKKQNTDDFNRMMSLAGPLSSSALEAVIKHTLLNPVGPKRKIRKLQDAVSNVPDAACRQHLFEVLRKQVELVKYRRKCRRAIGSSAAAAFDTVHRSSDQRAVVAVSSA